MSRGTHDDQPPLAIVGPGGEYSRPIDADASILEAITGSPRRKNGAKEPAPTHANVTIKPLMVRESELPAILGLGLTTLRAMRASGNFPPALRVGRRILWKTRDLEAFVEANLVWENAQRAMTET